MNYVVVTSALVSASVLAACTSAATCDFSDGSYPDEGTCVRVSVSASVGAPFDRIELFYGAPQASQIQLAPITPELLADGDVPTSFDLGLVSRQPGASDLAQAQTLFDDEFWEFYPAEAAEVGVVAWSGSNAVGAGVATLVFSTPSSGRRLDAALVLAPPTAVEVWGRTDTARSDGADAVNDCARIETPTITHYYVRDNDQDCDGTPDASDCRPDDYCDPSDTSAASVAACTCP
jgi:hypothetical protein